MTEESNIIKSKEDKYGEQEQQLKELFQLVHDLRFEKQKLVDENEKLLQEVEILRKALAEIEAQELTVAHQFLTTSINIKALLQDSYSKLQV